MAELYARKVTGDKTGKLHVLPNTRIYVETHSIRTEAPVNYQVDTGGQIVLPVRTTLRGTGSPALTVNGEIHGVEVLRVSSNVDILMTEKGASACVACSSGFKAPYVGHYWFQKLQVSLGGIVKVQSSTKNVSAKAVHLHMFETALDYTGSIKANAVNVYTDYFSIEFDATTDGSGFGWSAQQGPGSRTACSGQAGAGHGGSGGSGYWTGCGGSCYTHHGGELMFLSFLHFSVHFENSITVLASGACFGFVFEGRFLNMHEVRLLRLVDAQYVITTTVIGHFPIYHKHCFQFVFKSQEKLKTMLRQNFGGQKRALWLI